LGLCRFGRTSIIRPDDLEIIARRWIRLGWQYPPDFAARVDDLIIDSVTSEVAIRWSAIGTHRGQFLGMPPTSRKVHFTGIEIIRVQGGLVDERCGEWNGLEILEQVRG
jgi:predicted ester cyclase